VPGLQIVGQRWHRLGSTLQPEQGEVAGQAIRELLALTQGRQHGPLAHQRRLRGEPAVNVIQEERRAAGQLDELLLSG
jgi:hypothetical protein